MRETKSGLYQLEIEVTNRCNLSCSHCYMGKSKDEDIDPQIVFRIFDEANELDVSDIILSGGEPFLNSHVFEFARYAKDRNYDLNIGILTNGTTLKENANFDKLKVFDFIQLSMDFENEPSGFHLNNFAWILELGKKIRKAGVYVSFLSTISNENLVFLEATADKVASQGMQIGFNLLSSYGNDRNISKKCLDKTQMKKALEIVIKLQGKYNIRETLINSGSPHCVLLDKEKQYLSSQHSRSKILGGCTCAISTMTIGVDGSVMPCPFFRRSEDNVHNRSLRDIWYQSDLFNSLRDRSNIKGKCGACDYLNICGGCRASAYFRTGNYLEADNNCFR